MSNFRIYNHSSENMSEIENDLVDLIVTDPPWNMGATFGSIKNFSPQEEYKNLIRGVALECFRVLNKEGFMVLICSDVVKYSGNIFELQNFMTEVFVSVGFNLQKKIPLLFDEEVKTDWSVVPTTHIYNSEVEWAYSQNAGILVFSKKKEHNLDSSTLDNKMYTFKASEGHPCPSSLNMIKDILDLFFKKGMRVLDPFMGTATLGAETVERGGFFYGYETVCEYYNTALSKLTKESHPD